ncbi:MAG: RES family NAD+ phosphorylase [Gemmatimonadetes bacterium]|nr:RES family NAD+ phosphorylase [Gemmatimonadota bacterium]
MRLWRLAPGLYAPLSGEGARLAGGRWNSPGTAVVYASAHLSLAVLETLVHVDPADLPDGLLAYELEVPAALVEDLGAAELGPAWREDLRRTRALGDTWARHRRSLMLTVPSAVVPSERNLLVNPLHPAVGEVSVASAEPFVFTRPKTGQAPGEGFRCVS